MMAPLLTGVGAYVALDDTSFPKQRDDSVGVAKRWCGARGKTDSCQSGVSAMVVVPVPIFHPDLTSFPLGMRLYFPKERAEDPEQ